MVTVNLTYFEFKIVFINIFSSQAATGITVSDPVVSSYNDLKLKKNARYLMFKIVDNEIVYDKTGDREQTYDLFLAQLPTNEPRYCVYDFDIKLVFIAW